MYCRWMQLLSWNPIRCFCDEQHSFNKCTLPCRRDLPGATACLERKCCLMNIYWLWIFIKLTALWPASGFVTSVAVKWLSKVFNPVLELFEAQITKKITKTKFPSEMETSLKYSDVLTIRIKAFGLGNMVRVTQPFISCVLVQSPQWNASVISSRCICFCFCFHFLNPHAYSIIIMYHDVLHGLVNQFPSPAIIKGLLAILQPI